MVGAAIYISPEQARGLPVDARTDIFSLGIVLYEMVSGRLPFDGTNSNEILAAIQSDKKPQPLARYSSEAACSTTRSFNASVFKRIGTSATGAPVVTSVVVCTASLLAAPDKRCNC